MKHYLHETGTLLLFDTGVNIGTAAESFIRYRKPDGVEGTWAGTLYSSYSTLAKLTGTYFVSKTLAYSDIDVSGDWKFQPVVGAADGTWPGESVEVTFFDNLQ